MFNTFSLCHSILLHVTSFGNYFFCMYGLLGLLPTSGDNFKSTATLEIHLLRKMVTCSMLILSAAFINRCCKMHAVQKNINFRLLIM